MLPKTFLQDKNKTNSKLLIVMVDVYNKETMLKMGCPFWQYALFFEISVDEKDLDYLLNVIKKDKLYLLICEVFYAKKGSEYKRYRAYAKINQVVFYEKFYNSPNCPQGMKNILFVYLGLLKDWLNENTPGLLEQRYFFVERWFDTIR